MIEVRTVSTKLFQFREGAEERMADACDYDND